MSVTTTKFALLLHALMHVRIKVGLGLTNSQMTWSYKGSDGSKSYSAGRQDVDNLKFFIN